MAFLEDGELAEIFIARGERMVGSIYKGKVINVLPGMQAAFVNIGLERNTFLCMDDALPSYLHEELEEDSRRSKKYVNSIEEIVKPNQETLVQLIKEPIGSKGGRITTNISFPGRYMVLLPLGKDVGVSRRVASAAERERLRKIAEKIRPKNFGLILRTAAESKEESVLKKELDGLMQSWEGVVRKSKKNRAPALLYQELGLIDRILRDSLSETVQKLLVDSRPVYEKILQTVKGMNPSLTRQIFYYQGSRPLFEAYHVEEILEKLLEKKVWLPSGGYLFIEPTEALTVIDVNSGKFVGTHSLEDTILKINLEAAAEIARQIRLRDLSGIIVVDFIDMERRGNRRKLVSALEEHLKSDRVRASVFGVTKLGLVEITRKRSGKNWDQISREPCFYCGGHGRIQNPESVAIQLERALRKEALQKSAKAVLVELHPHVALHLSGWEGEGITSLQQAIGKEIFLSCDFNFHLERFSFEWNSPEVFQEKTGAFMEKELLRVKIEENHPVNLQNGVAYVNGRIVEVVNAGNRAGETLSARVISSSSSYALTKPESSGAGP